MKKRSIMLGSAVFLAVLLVVGGTMAWFTATADPVVNSFTAGTVDIEINDTFNTELAQNVNPGDVYSKEVSVTNTGSKRAYIRVNLTPLFSGQQDISVVTYPILTDWVLHTDGYYYYKNIVEAGASTTNIINEVLFAGAAMNNTYQGATFTLTVNAEAIQATNGAISDQWLVTPTQITALGLEVLP